MATPASRAKDALGGYAPLVWSEDCELTLEERDIIEAQRRDLWRHGIRKQPMLDVMAYEFGYVVCLLREAEKETGGKVEFPPHWKHENVSVSTADQEKEK